MIILLFLLQTIRFGEPQNIPPPITGPCEPNPEITCTFFTMIIKGDTRWFKKEDFGKEPKDIKEDAQCEGRWTRGSFRYMTDKTAPSSLVGTLVPQRTPEMVDPTGTLESEEVIILYSKELILGFKATQANWGGGEMEWECAI